MEKKGESECGERENVIVGERATSTKGGRRQGGSKGRSEGRVRQHVAPEMWQGMKVIEGRCATIERARIYVESKNIY